MRARCSSAKGRASPICPEEEGLRRCRVAGRPNSAGGAGPRPREQFGVQFDVMQLGAERIYDSGPGRARPRSCSQSAGSLTRPRARSGSAPPISATTRTACSGRATARSPISCPTSPTTSTSTTAASIARSTSGAPTTTATSPGCGRCSPALGYPPEFFDVALVQLVQGGAGRGRGEDVEALRASSSPCAICMKRSASTPRATSSSCPKGRKPARLRCRPGQEADRREPGLLRADGARAAERHLPHRRARRRTPSTGELDLRRAARAAGRRAAQEAGARFPRSVEKAAREREPHRITVYLHELATVVHGWYHHTRAVGAPEGPRPSRPGSCSPAPPASCWPTPSPC